MKKHNKSKKILFVIPYLGSGGAERVVSIWTSELAKMNYDVNLLLFYRMENEYEISEKVNLYVLKNTKDDYKKLNIINKIILVRKKLREINPSIIIPFISYVGIIMNVARIGLGIKIVETIRNNPDKSPKSNIIRKLRNLSVFFADRCIVQNREQMKYFPKVLHEKIVIFANPISNDFLLKKKEYRNSEIKNIIAVGRLEEQKNHKMLIEAVYKLNKSDKKINLNIYGEGQLYKELKEYIDSLGMKDNIFLKGRSNSIVNELLQADMYILSSNSEGMPNSLMEAMAIGLPCISTDCPTGPSDLIINNINGILIPVNGEEEMENAICYMLDNIDKASEMGKKARETIKNRYEATKSAAKLGEFLNSIK